MSKRIKLKKDNYLDSTSIVYGNKMLSNVINKLIQDTGWVDCDMVEGYTGLKARVIGKVLYIAGNVVGTLAKDEYTHVANLPQKIKEVWEAPNFDEQFTNYCRGQNNSQSSITLTGGNGKIEICPTISGNWARVFLVMPSRQ